MKKKLLIVLACFIGLVGIVWFGQGIGLIHGSVMTNETQWAVIGAILIAVAAGILRFALRVRSKA